MQSGGAPGEIASALRASSLRDHRRLRSGVQLGLRPSCRTRFVVCREFEFKAPRSNWLLAVLNAKNGGAPGEIASALRASSLRNHRRLRSGVQLGLRPSCRTRFVVCRELGFKAPRCSWLLAVLNAKNGGAPGEIRTPDLLVRSQALYPTELRAQGARILTSSIRDHHCRNVRHPIGYSAQSGPPNQPHACISGACRRVAEREGFEPSKGF